MSPIAMYFASGESLYPGVVLLLLSIAITRFRLPSAIHLLGRVSMWIGLALVIMACPPVSLLVEILSGFIFLTWIISGYRRRIPGQGQGTFRTVVALSLVFILLAVGTTELLHRRIPRISGEKAQHLVVLGDSISAGIGTRARPWPDVMRERTGAEIVNLSIRGATMASGLAMAERLSAKDRLILIELGGNDLISGESSESFERSLHAVLERLALPGRILAMFELPLIPQMIRYGRVQRRLATKYGVWLIPKRCLAEIFSGEGATSDGLHLTDAGANRMASLVMDVLSPILPTRPIPTTPVEQP